MMYKFFAVVVCITLLPHIATAQRLTQNVSGSVIDAETEAPLAFVNLHVKDSDPIIGAITDENGYFTLKNVPVGRADIEISYMGYKTLIVPEVVVTSAAPVQLNIRLNPSFSSLDEVVITPNINKQKPINHTAMVSARMLSVEEAGRYAGAFDDPARLASSFAGVASSNGGDNSIVVRGNAPKFLQWKIEGVEIPNPNHFANLTSFGGGGLTAMSSNLLANSDFMTGAYPAEYNNALGGVFDMRMRTGNSASYEHSLEVGLIGIDLTSEGPVSKKNNSSYLVNYRYSSLGLLSSLMPEDAGGTKYQDLSFKLNFPTRNAGRFSLWGIGLIDESGTTPESDLINRDYYQDIEKQDVKQYMGSLGLEHRYFLKNEAYVNSILALSAEGLDLSTDRLNEEEELLPENRIKSNRYNLTVKTYYNSRFSGQLSNRTGITLRGLGYHLNIGETINGESLQTIANTSGFTSLLASYTNFTFTQKQFKFNFGATAQWFTLNSSFTLEPRFAATYQINQSSGLSLGYGLHSRLEPLQIYFANTANAATPNANKSLGFTKAHHFVLAYDWDISEKVHLKIEPYYQALFDVPMVDRGNVSLLNVQADWFADDIYSNSGKGRNYGLDITLEQYMVNGFYYLVSGSIFNSAYKTENSEWFNTRFNKNFLFNALTGKEFKMGNNKQHIFGLNVRASLQGGDRFSKIDENASEREADVVYDETLPFTEQTKPSMVLHTTLSYAWNRKKTTHKLALKILNASNHKSFQGHRYNLRTKAVEEYREVLMIPNISYKISF